jgi:hypothetical protein
MKIYSPQEMAKIYLGWHPAATDGQAAYLKAAHLFAATKDQYWGQVAGLIRKAFIALGINVPKVSKALASVKESS